jgi:hypothetical protein
VSGGGSAAAAVSAASFAQARIKFLDELASGGSAYHISRVIDLEGELDVAALDRSIRACARRHESLRTCLTVMGGELKQVVTAKEPILRVVDLRDVLAAGPDPAVGERVVRQLTRDEAAAPFNIKRAPLLRSCLIRLAENRHVLLLTLHHIIADAWSLEILLREIAALYRADLAGPEHAPPPLPPLPLQYADYTLWQRRRLENGDLDRHLDYWRDQLDGLTELRLRTDRPRPTTPSHRGERHTLAVDPDLVDRLRRIGREEGATLFMTLLAGFNTLLYRATGREDVAVGGTSSGRDRPELRDMIGIFVNMLVLRTRLDGRAALRENLRRTAESCQDGFEHQEVPFDQVVAQHGGTRGPDRHALFQIVFQMISGAAADAEAGMELPGLETRVHQFYQELSTFDLVCTVVESARGVTAEFAYSADLFDRDTIERLGDCWLLVLRQLVEDPDLAANAFPLPALPDLADEPQPDPAQSAAPAEAGSLLGPTEKQLADLWGAVLGRSDVGRQDNFFVLGGHSLLTIALLSRIREGFGIDLALSRFFECGNLAELAAEIDGRLARKNPAGP